MVGERVLVPYGRSDQSIGVASVDRVALVDALLRAGP
jgi:hypothetical protein